MSDRDNDLRTRLVNALGNASKTHPCTCGSTIWSTCYHQGALSNDERRADAILAALGDDQNEPLEQARRIAVELENQVARLTSADPWQRAVDGLNALAEAGIGFWIEPDGHISNPLGDEHIEYDRETERWQLVHDEEDA
ncbi:hypothetical protein ACIP69_18075 [Streptomyces hygroscopicus]|uniref:hypothetical protein n=1 Tax=Streptomyces hygroscopicus TaxID=1912 RepID=UPI0037F1112B